MILLLVAFLTLVITKRKKSIPETTGIDNRRQIFERGAGKDNKAIDNKTERRKESPTYINFRNQPSNQTIRSGISANRPQSSISSSSLRSA